MPELNRISNVWNIVSLKKYFERLFLEHNARHTRSELQMNDLRAAQRDMLQAQIEGVQRSLLAFIESSRLSIEKVERSTEERFHSVNEFRAVLATQQGTYITRTEVEAAVNRVNERLQETADRLNSMTGKGQGFHEGWGYLVGVVGVIAAIVAIVYHLR